MRDILVHATQYDRWTPSVRHAAELAGRLRASLTAVWCEPPVDAVVAGDVGALVALAAVAPPIHVDRARAVASRFGSWSASLGAAHSDWLVCELDPVFAIQQLARWHDLVVLGGGRNTPWGSDAALAEMLVRTQSPCLVVPEDRDPPFRLRRAAIAWNGSTCAAAAVHDAIPLLTLCEKVFVLSGEHAGQASRQPKFDIGRYLDRHGIAHDTIALDDNAAESAGEVLLQEATAVQADLLVMGAFGRSRLSEWVLGGVSRHMLAHCTIPMLMRH
ncbi:universal stress protein [Lysobacter arvi]|uniref:Universal stress protein n=1 Tax=Lysobacter arvi TaxID=3038776 RepID=A0ABU1C9W6_9GAMM|nr:universal stress protein [Lysobacter arvi]MDR0181979.1 universal stress protein [Lysobacter arvi]